MKSINLGLIYLHQGGFAPPLGLLSIATYLKQNFKTAPLQTKIIDINVDNILKTIKNSDLDLVGISAMTIEYKKAIRLAQEIKKIKPDVFLIIGGIHISILPQSLHSLFDLGVIGEGEETLEELLKLFASKRSFPIADLKKIKGLVFREESNIFISETRPLIEPLDRLPVVDRTLLHEDYFKFYPLTSWGEFGRETSILTSRGCPYRCVFCSTSHFWKKVRYHSLDHVVADIKDLINNYGATHIQIWDDLFTIHRERLREMAKRFQEEGISQQVKFSVQPRANLMDDDLCQILKSMNVKITMFGFESGCEKTLNFLKAGTVTGEQNKKAINLCVKHGFKVQGSIIFGVPGETISDMKETIRFLKFALRAGVERLWSFVLTPFPGTPLWEMMKIKGRVADDMDWDKLSHLSVDNPLCLDESVSQEEFKKIFLEGRTVINRFKWRKIWSFFCHNPFWTIYFFLKSPWTYASYLFSKKGF